MVKFVLFKNKVADTLFQHPIVADESYKLRNFLKFTGNQQRQFPPNHDVRSADGFYCGLVAGPILEGSLG